MWHVALVVVAVAQCFPLRTEGKGVHVKVVAPWTETPLLQEGCEAVASFSSRAETLIDGEETTGFYRCLEDVWRYTKSANRSGGAGTMTQKEQYDILMDVIKGGNHPPNYVALFTTKLAVRMHSPAVEAHRQLAGKAIKHVGGCAAEGNPFVLIENKVVCDGERLRTEIKALKYRKRNNSSGIAASHPDYQAEMHTDNTMAVIPDLDHVHPRLRGPHTAIMYGIVGERQTMLLLHTMKSHGQGTARLVFRHLPVSGKQWSNMLAVQGYGVAVDIKSTEYKVVDDRSGGESAAKAQQRSERGDTDGDVAEDDGEGSPGGFNVSLLMRRFPDQRLQLSQFGGALKKNIEREIRVDLHSWEKLHIGIAAVQYVMDARRDPLDALLNVLTRFPNYATQLTSMSFPASIRLDAKLGFELNAIGRRIHRATSYVFLNGCAVSTEDINLFYVMEQIEGYERVLDSLSRIIASHQKSHSYGDTVHDNAAGLMDAVGELANVQIHKNSFYSDNEYSTARVWLPQNLVSWLNDVENDRYFSSLPSTLRSILDDNTGRSSLPRRNLLHVTCVVDPTTSEGVETIFELLRRTQQPLRFGVVFVDRQWSPEVSVTGNSLDDDATSDASKATLVIAATVWELMREKADPDAVENFLIAAGREVMSSRRISVMNVKLITQSFLLKNKKRAVDDVIVDPGFITHFEETQEVVRSLELSKFPVVLLNGRVEKDLSTTLQRSIGKEFAHLQELVEKGALSDEDENLYDTILNVSGAKARYVGAMYENKTFLDWSSSSVLKFLQNYPFISPPPSGTNETFLVSGVLILRAPVMSSSLKAALRAARSLLLCKEANHACSRTRLTFSTCGASTKQNSRTVVEDLQVLLKHQSAVEAGKYFELLEEFILQITDHSGPEGRLDDPKVYEEVLKGAQFSDELNKLLNKPSAWLREQIELAAAFCREMSNDTSAEGDGASGGVDYLVNGRLFAYDNFTEDDFQTATLEASQVSQDVWAVLKQVDFTGIIPGLEEPDVSGNFYAAKIAAAVAVLRRDAAHNDRRGEQRLQLPVSPGPLSFVAGSPNGGTPRHQLTIVVDPVARASQHLVSLCHFISRLPIGAICTVYLNPSFSVEKTIRNYYQFVGEPELRFDTEGRVVPPAAVLSGLPEKHLLTLSVEEPEYWTVFPMEAEYDLDNIFLSKLPQSSNYLYATYRINSILISGSAEDVMTRGASSGLPLQVRSTLYNHTNGVLANITRDTIVMTIKGYFQLQSTPGLWYLSVQPGDVAQAFFISHRDGALVPEALADSTGREFNYTAGQSLPVVVSSFKGPFIEIGISRVMGYEQASIESIAAAAVERSHTEWPPKGPRSERPRSPTLNIFTVASGHLYERFLRIMMHTVMRTSSDVHGANTTRIKFWLIENFLSPQFKALVPLLAEHYGFDVGFVTYRWPWWLNKQTEKQRTIWAYKILFLDVLFPLDVDRIIFVDADQIVRADLHELYNMDIGDAPVAYTPFCRSYPNTATTNFRFWDRGFWLNHLRGKPYHISALYLVNVQRLRAALGGDKYRATYSSLSHDPGSLANLDQDLPNFMQDQIPIFSLPEEWLWCETWCAGESKPFAKTIDLCNNPLTKIPKLENVRRIIDGWDELDQELEELSRRLLERHAARHNDNLEGETKRNWRKQ